MLETAHEHAVKVLRLLHLLEVDLSGDNRRVDRLLVLEAVDVLAGVRVKVLERLGELVVEAVNEGDDAAANDDDRLSRRGNALLVLLVVRRSLANGVRRVLDEDGEESVELLAGGLPRVEGHERRDGGVVVEVRGDEGEDDADLLVGRCGYGEETLEGLDLLVAVGVLATTGLEDGGESLVDTLGGGRGGDLALDGANGLETVLVSGGGGGGNRRLDLFGCRRSGEGSLSSLVESFRVLEGKNSVSGGLKRLGKKRRRTAL